MTAESIQSRGPGPFVTHHVRPHPLGGHEVATSRRHRKGLPPHRVLDAASAERPKPSSPAAFAHLWAPSRLGWWVALLFGVGSLHFAIGGFAAAYPEAAPSPLRDPHTLNWIFFVGSIFFTLAAWLQWLEALNADVANAFETSAPKKWRWIGWRPHDLGTLSSGIQLIGTVFFNVNTADAMIAGLDWKGEDLLIWTPNMLGCACFLAASLLASIEVCQGHWTVAPRSVSWWIAVVNLLGSVAFQISALCAFTGPGPVAPSALFWAAFSTAIGAACFFIGAYLLIPELFDQSPPSVDDPSSHIG
jgi:hypothetical protein